MRTSPRRYAPYMVRACPIWSEREGTPLRRAARPGARARHRQPPVARARADADAAGRPRRSRLPPTGLGRDPAPPHRHLRIGLETGVHGLGRRPLARQPDEGLLLAPAGAGARGRRRRGGARARGGGPRGGGSGRPESLALVRAPRCRTRVRGVRTRRLQPVRVVRHRADRAGDPHRHVEGRVGWLRRADAGARLDALQGPGRHRRRAGRVRGSVRGHAARDHAPSTAARREGDGLRRGRTRVERNRDPARAVPGRRGARRRALRGSRRISRGSSVRPSSGTRPRSPSSRRQRRGRAASCSRATGSRWRTRARSTSCTTPIGKQETFEVGTRVLPPAGRS